MRTQWLNCHFYLKNLFEIPSKSTCSEICAIKIPSLLQAFFFFMQLPSCGLFFFFFSYVNGLWYFELSTRALKFEDAVFKDEGFWLFVLRWAVCCLSYQHVAVRCVSDFFPSFLSPLSIPSFVVAVRGLPVRGCVSRLPLLIDPDSMTTQ